MGNFWLLQEDGKQIDAALDFVFYSNFIRSVFLFHLMETWFLQEKKEKKETKPMCDSMHSSHLQFPDSGLGWRWGISQHIIHFFRKKWIVHVSPDPSAKGCPLTQPTFRSGIVCFSLAFYNYWLKHCPTGAVTWWSPACIVLPPTTGEESLGTGYWISNIWGLPHWGLLFCLSNWYFPHNADVFLLERFLAILLRYFLVF